MKNHYTASRTKADDDLQNTITQLTRAGNRNVIVSLHNTKIQIEGKPGGRTLTLRFPDPNGTRAAYEVEMTRDVVSLLQRALDTLATMQPTPVLLQSRKGGS